VHDPLAQDAALIALGDKVVGASSLEGCVRECDLLIVATAWPEYKEIDPAWCKRGEWPPHSPSTCGAPCRPASSTMWPTCSISDRVASSLPGGATGMISRRWEPIGVAVAGFIALLSLILWLDNVHIATMNGMYKSIQLEAWIDAPASARLDPSNYIYFPLYAALCRLLDWIGVFRGLAWKQIAVLNAAMAGLALASIYTLIRYLTGRRDAAVLASVLHFGCGFFLLLAVINEDIMPGYTLVLIAMALAAARFDRRPRPSSWASASCSRLAGCSNGA